MEHREMRHNVAEMTEHEILKTIEKILDDSEDELTCEELEKLDHCWHIIKSIYAAMTYAKQVSA